MAYANNSVNSPADHVTSGPADPNRYRQRIEAVIDWLIALLDEVDGDPDLEDSDEDKAVDDDRCDLADSGDDEPEQEGFNPYEPAFVMDQTRAAT